MREDRDILTTQAIAERLITDLAYMPEEWTIEIEGLEQVLKAQYGNEWKDKLTEIVSEIIDNEVFKDGSRKAYDIWEWLHEYEEVVEYAIGTILESSAYQNIKNFIKERLVEEVMQNRLDMRM